MFYFLLFVLARPLSLFRSVRSVVVWISYIHNTKTVQWTSVKHHWLTMSNNNSIAVTSHRLFSFCFPLHEFSSCLLGTCYNPIGTFELNSGSSDGRIPTDAV